MEYGHPEDRPAEADPSVLYVEVEVPKDQLDNPALIDIEIKDKDSKHSKDHHTTSSTDSKPIPTDQPAPSPSLLTQYAKPLGQSTSKFPRKRVKSSELQDKNKDELETSFPKRLVGNLLAARVLRANYQSISSTAKLPVYLSPWGDNSPFQLPNLRRRDVLLAGAMHLGADALLGSSLTLMGAVVEKGATFSAEKGIEHGIEGVSRWIRGPHRVLKEVTPGVTTVEVRIKHKLLGEDAVLRFWEERPAEKGKWFGCAKGWFAPYLYASSRTPWIGRFGEWGMVECTGPGLRADGDLAPALIKCLKEQRDAPICRLDAYEAIETSEEEEGKEGSGEYRRVAVFFLGISPYRTDSIWSQSKIPKEARLRLHLLSHVPVVTLPVTSAAPVCAWSPWTLAQMISGKDEYDPDKHAEEILRYLDGLVDVERVDAKAREHWREELGAAIRAIVNGARKMEETLGELAGAFVGRERAGVVVFRF